MKLQSLEYCKGYMAAREKYADINPYDKSAVIDTGLFNGFIEAYLILTLKDMGEPHSKIEKARKTLKELFEEVHADEAQTAAALYLLKNS